MIKEIWGNGKDVIIRYKKPGLEMVWTAASAWMENNSNMSDQWLLKNGYRRLKYDLG